MIDNFKEILRICHEKNQPRPVELVQLSQSFGRVAAFDICLNADIPPADLAIKSGYAVNVDDLKESSVHLKIAGKSSHGQPYLKPLGVMEAVYVEVGSPMPKGSNLLISKEEVEVGEFNGVEMVKITKNYFIGEKIAFKGFDIEKGDLLVKFGDKIQTCHIAAMSLYWAHVTVMKRPKVCFYSNSDISLNFVKKDEKKSSLHEYNCNRISPFLKTITCGANAEYCGLDFVESEAQLMSEIQKNFLNHEMIVVFNKEDVTQKNEQFFLELSKQAFDNGWDGELLMENFQYSVGWHEKISLNLIGGKVIIFLPPFSPATLIYIMSFITPMLDAINCQNPQKNQVKAVLDRDLDIVDLEHDAVPGVLSVNSNMTYVVSPFSAQDVPMFSMLIDANCLVFINKDKPLKKGTEVTVLKIN